MGPEAAVNAVYFNTIEGLSEPERSEFVARKRAEYQEDVDLLRLAAEGVIDAVIEPEDLRAELIRRYAIAANKDRRFSERRHGVPPV
jgi:acetyl-CoA carboxylase carboxyltransferase component